MNWQETAEVGDPKRNGKYVVYHDGMIQLVLFKKRKWYKFLDEVTFPIKGKVRYWCEVTDGPWVKVL